MTHVKAVFFYVENQCNFVVFSFRRSTDHTGVNAWPPARDRQYGPRLGLVSARVIKDSLGLLSLSTHAGAPDRCGQAVIMSRRERALAPAVAIISIGAALIPVPCVGTGDFAGPSVPPKVTTQTGDAVPLAVGFSGGILTATAADKTSYSPEIPDGALDGQTLITMTAFSTIAGIPVAESLAGGLEFMPSGLVFATLARLIIDSQMATAAGRIPAARSSSTAYFTARRGSRAA
ncbi:MAG: hypothetical protein IPO18_11220 [bacterium]|nr:hypothetical protein [bacterium]MBK9472843.1 hypothetical protein [bacterium]